MKHLWFLTGTYEFQKLWIQTNPTAGEKIRELARLGGDTSGILWCVILKYFGNHFIIVMAKCWWCVRNHISSYNLNNICTCSRQCKLCACVSTSRVVAFTLGCAAQRGSDLWRRITFEITMIRKKFTCITTTMAK